jgi:hypothetical protein
MATLQPTRFFARHPEMLLGVATAVLMVPGLLILGARGYIEDWSGHYTGDEASYWFVLILIEFLEFVATTAVVCLVGCWLGRSGLSPRGVLYGMIWYIFFAYFVAIPSSILVRLGMDALNRIFGFCNLDNMQILAAPIQSRMPLYAVAASAPVLPAFLLGWLLAERITRRMLQSGKWQYVVPVPETPLN